MGCSLWQLFV